MLIGWVPQCIYRERIATPDASRAIQPLLHSSSMAVSITLLLSGLVAAAVTQLAWTFLTNVFRHPLAQFPGPLLASTGWYKTWQEVFRGRNWIDVLRELHAQYGEVVRVGPNEACEHIVT